jgi:hypothetical protein
MEAAGAPPVPNASTATTFAASADEHESRGEYAEAKLAHQEAARLFRLACAGVSNNEDLLQQLRALARHHEARARYCDAIEAKNELVRAHRFASENVLAKPQVLMAPSDPTALPPPRSTFEARTVDPGSWDIWRPIDALMDRIFPKDLFGASPPKLSGPSLVPLHAKKNLFESEEDDDKNAMLESFMVVQDYEPPSSPGRPVLRLTKKESSVLESVICGKLLQGDDQDELQALVEKLHRELDEMAQENRRLKEHVAELEKEKRIMRESVMTFREEVGRSMIAARHASPTAPLELLLDYEARSQLKDSHSRSPSPDIQEYIRNLERKVEQQQQKLDEWSRLYKPQKKP